MRKSSSESNNCSECADDGSHPNKKPYIAPVVKAQAHLRDITLGGSGGVGDSTGAFNTKPNSAPSSQGDIDESSDSSGGKAIFENDIFGG